MKRTKFYYISAGLLFLLSLGNLLFSTVLYTELWESIICLLLFTVIPFFLVPVIKYRFFKNLYYADSAWKTQLTTLILGISFLLFLLLLFAQNMYGKIPFSQLLYHLKSSTKGTNWSQFQGVVIFVLTGFVVIATLFFVVNRHLRFWWSDRIRNIYYMTAPAFLFVILYAFFICYGVDEYIAFSFESTTLYDDYYVDPESVSITFPETKRNLIYIYMESMESSYTDKKSGGAQRTNIIPELTDIALSNENFSDGSSVNGARTVVGTTYTMGGLVAQTTGLPINSNYLSNETVNDNSSTDFFTGIENLGDLLSANGYNQEFLLGSDATFAGRKSFFEQHGNYNVLDYYSVIDKHWLDKDYLAWWGFEDEKLYYYARAEARKLSLEDKPFNLTLLTADTHFTDGYACRLCDDTYPTQYANVLACASRQVVQFVEWVQKQDFYENTTIIISGDHLTMDANYTDKYIPSNYTRKTYVTVINPAISSELHTNRSYTTMDLFPTTLASLGVEIKGNRLALGTNLFSSTPTLSEELGFDYLDEEVQKKSKTYQQILFK